MLTRARTPPCSSSLCSKGRSVAFYIQRELSDLANMDDTDLLVAPESDENMSVILYVWCRPS